MTHRDQQGRFIDRSAMMHAWLGRFLSWATDPLPSMCRLAAEWCVSEAARCHERACRFLSNPREYGDPKGNHAWQTKQADRWLARRDVLLEVITTLEAIK